MATIFKKPDRRCWVISYHTADGKRIERSSGTTDKRVAERIASKLSNDVALQRDGIIDARQSRCAIEGRRPITEHLADYETYLRSKGVSEHHLKQTRKRLDKLTVARGFALLSDIESTPIEQYLALLAESKRGPRTRNTYVSSIRAFIAWCIKTGRLSVDPLSTLAKANESEDIRRKRRALSTTELQRLLMVASWRPLAEYGRATKSKKPEERKGKRDTWTKESLTLENFARAVDVARDTLRLRPAFIEKLERLGRERRLIYMTLVMTGLRKGELAALAWNALELAAAQPTLTIDASISKNGQTVTLPIHLDLAAELRAWQLSCEDWAPKSRVFRVSTDLLRAFDRDLEVAGIAKVDDGGRQVDLHALRYCTATFLAKGGIAPRVAQAYMRHSKIDLTMQTYTDPRMLDLAKALGAMPELSSESANRELHRATGTLDSLPVAGAFQHQSHRQQKRQQSGRNSQAIGAKGREMPVGGEGKAPRSQASQSARVSEEMRLFATTCETAGDAIRTRNVQLGRLMLYH